MNDLNQVESQLRSWIPRQPSAALKARIFAPPAVPADAEEERRPLRMHVPAWQWLAPAMAVFVVAMMSWTDGARTSFVTSDPAVTASTLSSPEMAAYYAPTHTEHNSWPVATFDWTQDRPSLSTTAPVLTVSTNP